MFERRLFLRNLQEMCLNRLLYSVDAKRLSGEGGGRRSHRKLVRWWLVVLLDVTCSRHVSKC